MTAPQQLAAFNYEVPPFGKQPIKNRSTAYLVQPSDNGLIINCTSGTFTVSLTAAATLGSGFNCWVWNTGSGAITIDPNGAETIDGVTTLILRNGEGTQIVCDGTNWQTGSKKTMRGYAERLNESADRPRASGDTTVAIGFGANVSGSDSIGFGLNCVASGTSSAAFGRSATASNSDSLALGRSTTASAADSTAIGRNSSTQGSQAVTGSGAMALGGSYASGTDSFSAAVASNISTYGATGTNSIAFGLQAKASTTGSTALGYLCESTGTGSMCYGYQSQSNGSVSTARGYRSLSSIYGKDTYASGFFAAIGDAQTGTFVLRSDTTDATPEALTANNSAPGADDQIILPNSSAYAFTGIIVARQQASGGTASAAWKIEGLIRREANAASTTLVASTVTAISNAPGWTLALSADTTNGGLKIEATGAAATNIRWVATVRTSEVTYA